MSIVKHSLKRQGEQNSLLANKVIIGVSVYLILDTNK